MTGQTVCDRHGGKAPQALARAERDRIERQAADLLEQLDVAPVENPLAELAQLAGEVVAWKNIITQLVSDLRDFRYQDARSTEQLRAEVALLERAFDRCNVVLAGMARLRIDERLVQIERAKVDLVAGVLDEVLTDDLGLSREQQHKARRGFIRRLRLVEANGGDQAVTDDSATVS